MILRGFLAVVAAVFGITAAQAEEWRQADDLLSKHVVNCLIDGWLQSADRRHFKTRYDVVLRVVSIDEFRVPEAREKERFENTPGLAHFCVKGKQRDYQALLMKDGNLTITNGRPIAKDQVVRGYAYGIMDVYQKGNQLAIYVQSGAYSKKPKRGGGDCVYDATSSGYRIYFNMWPNTLILVGKEPLWVADAGVPPCWEER